MGLKEKTHRNRDYLDWLRDQPCVVTDRYPPSDPCHTFKGTGGGGIGLKSGDKFALPLSHDEHLKQSGMGELKYWADVMVQRPVLRLRMIKAFMRETHDDYFFNDPNSERWLELIRNKDVLIKRVVQAFAETEYYNNFMKGEI